MKNHATFVRLVAVLGWALLAAGYTGNLPLARAQEPVLIATQSPVQLHRSAWTGQQRRGSVSGFTLRSRTPMAPDRSVHGHVGANIAARTRGPVMMYRGPVSR
jgi:hypothetical protein